MEMLSKLLALWEGNPLVPSGFPSQTANNLESINYWPFVQGIHGDWWITLTKGQVMRQFYCFFVVNLSKLLNQYLY